MDQAGRVAIGTVVMRNKQYLAAIRPLDGALAMSTMRFADEIVARKGIDGIPSGAIQAGCQGAAPGRPDRRLPHHRVGPEPLPRHVHRQLRDLITRKAKGEELTVDDDEEPTSNVVDLMAALEASLAGRPPKAAARAKKRASKAGRATKTTASGDEATEEGVHLAAGARPEDGSAGLDEEFGPPTSKTLT